MGARFLILASLLLAMSGTAFATDEQLALTCYANSSSNTNMPTFASPVNPYETGYYETSFGSNDTATGGGFHVANTTDKEVDCMWVVPPNYDTSAGSPPYIVVYGWFEATDTCYSSCPSFEYVRLKVASRVYNTGPLNAS